MVSGGEQRDGAQDGGLENTKYNAGTDTLHLHCCPQGLISAEGILLELEVVTVSGVGSAVSLRGFHCGERTKDQAIKKAGKDASSKFSMHSSWLTLLDSKCSYSSLHPGTCCVPLIGFSESFQDYPSHNYKQNSLCVLW